MLPQNWKEGCVAASLVRAAALTASMSRRSAQSSAAARLHAEAERLERSDQIRRAGLLRIAACTDQRLGDQRAGESGYQRDGDPAAAEQAHGSLTDGRGLGG
jgi:hypothetical protein